VAPAEGTREFFQAVDRQRYGTYAPWLPEVAGFSSYGRYRLLEVGCGMGTDLAAFARGDAQVFAVDLTPRHLAIARQRLVAEGHAVRLARSDAEVLPFADNSFDVVYSFGVLHHTPGTQQAFDEIHRVLRPGGRAIIALYHRNSAFFWIHTIFVRGFLWGELFRLGYRQLMADIESGQGNALPMVKVYSRFQLGRMFKAFRSVTTEVHHLEAGHFSYFAPVARRMPDWMFRALSQRYGWYVVARACK
jgi:SAM-dependent methyltransferase